LAEGFVKNVLQLWHSHHLFQHEAAILAANATNAGLLGEIAVLKAQAAAAETKMSQVHLVSVIPVFFVPLIFLAHKGFSTVTGGGPCSSGSRSRTHPKRSSSDNGRRHRKRSEPGLHVESMFFVVFVCFFCFFLFAVCSGFIFCVG
jgi:hypothetical protein